MAPAAVLVIDDDPQIASMMKMILGREGHQVEAALTGEQALRLAAERRPDVILLDLHMPDIPGPEIIARLRDELGLDQVPIIVATGDTEAPELPEAFATMIKPFHLESLLETIEAALARGSNRE
ncbi:MAG: response regulator transcription factor [Armatimonadota bacterium]